MDSKILERLLQVEIDSERKFWVIYDWLKRDLFVYLKDELSDLDWLGDWVHGLEKIQRRLIWEWKSIEGLLVSPQISLPRVRGVLYEVLFYLNCIKTVSVFKGSWIMEVTGDPLVPGQEPPWLDIIPIFDIMPKLFRIRQNGKWVLRAPRVEADFLICYWDKEKTLPLAFVDVKSTLKKYDKKQMVWAALGCKWFNDSILEVATPKPGILDYPRGLEDWNISQVCWKCGVLNQKTTHCFRCGQKIWLAADEYWKPWPLK